MDPKGLKIAPHLGEKRYHSLSSSNVQDFKIRQRIHGHVPCMLDRAACESQRVEPSE